jgi:four helix bundle protein
MSGFGVMNQQEFKNRTKQLVIRTIKVVESLPQTTTAQVIGKQVLRSSTSVGANYRTACRAKSTPDMLYKLAIVEEEADETSYWLELLVEAEIIPAVRLQNLMSEVDEITAMIVSSIKTLRQKPKISNPKSNTPR